MYNDYYYGNDMVSDFATTATIMTGLGAVMAIFSLVLSLILIISYWKIFTKAGKPGWASIVPIYNIIVMLEIAELPTWNIVLFIIPFANIYIMFKLYIELAKKMGKSTGFGVGLAFLPIIFFPILAFSDVKKETDIKENANNSFDATKVINNSTETSNNMVEEQNNIVVDNNINIAPPMIEIENQVNVAPTLENAAPVEPVLSVVEEPVQINAVEPMVNDVESNVDTSNRTAIEEPVIIAEEPFNATPVAEEPVVNNIEPTVNAFNVAPTINEPVGNNVEPLNATPVAEEQAVNNIEPTVNAFNVAPTINEPVANTVESLNVTPVAEEPVVNNVGATPTMNEAVANTVEPLNVNDTEQKKICKNCGNELPNIVSICPNCGTDNE